MRFSLLRLFPILFSLSLPPAPPGSARPHLPDGPEKNLDWIQKKECCFRKIRPKLSLQSIIKLARGTAVRDSTSFIAFSSIHLFIHAHLTSYSSVQDKARFLLLRTTLSPSFAPLSLSFPPSWTLKRTSSLALRALLPLHLSLANNQSASLQLPKGWLCRRRSDLRLLQISRRTASMGPSQTGLLDRVSST
jgi:hypothetical protein